MDKHYVCDKHKTKGNTGKCPFCHPDHIADATQKVQPAPAPLPGDDGEICARLLSACTGHPHALIPWPHRLLHDAVAHITAQARRLAEAEKSAWEECHAMSSRLSKANQESNMWRNCAVYLDYRGADYCVAIHKELDGLQEDSRKHREQVSKLLAEWKRRAESVEARVRELVAEAAKRPLASDDEQTIAGLEAFKARVMEWARGRCGTCGTETESDDCRACRNGYDLEEYPQAAQYADNWTPPQAWEVGEPNGWTFWTCGICGVQRPDCVKPVLDEECGDACPEHYEAGEVGRG